MSLPKIGPAEARRLLNQGAILVDIREMDEHAREKITGAQHLPLSKLHEAKLALDEAKLALERQARHLSLKERCANCG